MTPLGWLGRKTSTQNNSSDNQSFPPKIHQLYENNYRYESNFNFYETSLNIQNCSAHITSVKIFNCLYRIRSNYRTYPYKHTVKKFRSLQITASVIFLYFFLKAYVVGTHLNCIDLSMQFKWVPHICLYNENQKQSHNHHQINPFSDLFYSVSLIGRYMFYHKWVFPVILENLSAQCSN